MTVELEPLVSTRRVDGVLERLRSLILRGSYPVGARLPNERKLAASLGVNRSSVREALRRLEFLELIEVRHGQGSFVREVSESSALQLIEALLRDPRTVTADLLRQILEFRRDMTVQVVGLAARNRTAEQIQRARALLAQESGTGSKPEAALELDVEMNRLLGEATGNLMYQVLTNLFTKLLQRLGPLYYNDHRDHVRSLETHHQLLGAIEAGDGAEARRIIEVMLGYSENSIMAELERLEAEGVIGPEARRGGS